jgi:pSer/pThr/pTyr-binding forkhead associated (FHA) protein
MQLALIMFKENGEQKLFPIEPGKTIIGRKEDCDLRIPLAEISRKHAVVIMSDEAATIRDMGSANGTYLNNKRVAEHELSPGDHIVIGPVVFTVQINGQPADVRPVQTRLEARSPAAKSASGQASGSAAGVAADSDVFTDDEDPISALEALAGTDDTAAMDLDDSFPGDDKA